MSVTFLIENSVLNIFKKLPPPSKKKRKKEKETDKNESKKQPRKTVFLEDKTTFQGMDVSYAKNKFHKFSAEYFLLDYFHAVLKKISPIFKKISGSF